MGNILKRNDIGNQQYWEADGMTEIEIIKELFKAHASHSNIVVELENLEKYVGKVTFFDGERVTIDDNELMVSLIKKVEECCME